MKVSVILLLVSVSWVVAFPGQQWKEEEGGKGGKGSWQEGGWIGGGHDSLVLEFVFVTHLTEYHTEFNSFEHTSSF